MQPFSSNIEFTWLNRPQIPLFMFYQLRTTDGKHNLEQDNISHAQNFLLVHMLVDRSARI